MQDLIALANEVESLVIANVPDASAYSKYGGKLFTLKPTEKEGQFCGVYIYKSHVRLSFSNGASLADPAKLLEGNGKLRRHINIKSISDINVKQLGKLIKQSSQL